MNKYKPEIWKDSLYDEQGHRVQKGTDVRAKVMNNIEQGIVQLESKIEELPQREEMDQVTQQLADTENLLENQLSVLNFSSQVVNGDWSDALNAAHNALPTDGGVIVVPSSITIKKAVTFSKRVYLKGVGFSHSTGISPSSTILKDGNFTGLTFLGWNSYIENIDVNGAINNGGDGINIVGSRTGMKNVSVRNQGGHGIRVGRARGDNTNGWNFVNLFTVNNGIDGIHFHYGDANNSDIPDLTSGILVGIDTRNNGRDGIHVGNTLNNTFLGIMSQHNKRHGVHVGSNATGNHFFNPYTELNEAGISEEFYLAPNSRENFVSGQRSRIVYNSIKDEGVANYILGKNAQLTGNPYYLWSGMYSSKVVIGNETLSGQWQMKNLSDRKLYIDLIGTGVSDHLVIGNDTRLLPIKVGKLEIGASGKGLSGVFVDSRTVTLGLIPANSTKEFNIPVASANTISAVTVTPRADMKTGLIWNSYIKTDGVVTLRIANITGTEIDGGSVAFKTTVINTDL